MNGSVKTALERFFDFPVHGATWRGEIVGGTTTFLTMAYIVFVQPALLSGAMFGLSTGLDFGAVMTATCLSAALATVAMGLYARYPIALAPGMGENFVFVFSLIPAAATLPAVRAGVVQPWQTALGVILVSGVLFVILSLTGARERILDVLSPSLKRAIAAGIGLFIAFIGLKNAGLIVKDPGTAVRLNPHVTSPGMFIFFVGLFISAALWARGVRGALLWGILAAVALAWGLRFGLEILPPLWRERPSVAESALIRHFQPARTLVSAPPFGAMMMRQAAAIAWEDPTEAVPAFLIILGIPLTYSIADGLALGFIAAAVVKALGGKARTIRPVEAIVALILLLYFVGIRARM